MKKCKITAMRKTEYPDLMQKYENPIQHACDIEVGQVFLSENGEKPQGLCDSAWESMAYFVKELAKGGGNFYDGWMKNEKSALLSCNDGSTEGATLGVGGFPPQAKRERASLWVFSTGIGIITMSFPSLVTLTV